MDPKQGINNIHRELENVYQNYIRRYEKINEIVDNQINKNKSSTIGSIVDKGPTDLYAQTVGELIQEFRKTYRGQILDRDTCMAFLNKSVGKLQKTIVDIFNMYKIPSTKLEILSNQLDGRVDFYGSFDEEKWKTTINTWGILDYNEGSGVYKNMWVEMITFDQNKKMLVPQYMITFEKKIERLSKTIYHEARHSEQFYHIILWAISKKIALQKQIFDILNRDHSVLSTIQHYLKIDIRDDAATILDKVDYYEKRIKSSIRNSTDLISFINNPILVELKEINKTIEKFPVEIVKYAIDELNKFKTKDGTFNLSNRILPDAINWHAQNKLAVTDSDPGYFSRLYEEDAYVVADVVGRKIKDKIAEISQTTPPIAINRENVNINQEDYLGKILLVAIATKKQNIGHASQFATEINNIYTAKQIEENRKYGKLNTAFRKYIKKHLGHNLYD